MNLVDRDKLLESFKQDIYNGNQMDYGDTEELMLNAQIVDAVEVVRCKDCVYWRFDGIHITGKCTHKNIGNLKLDNDFCSYGHKKEN